MVKDYLLETLSKHVSLHLHASPLMRLKITSHPFYVTDLHFLFNFLFLGGYYRTYHTVLVNVAR